MALSSSSRFSLASFAIATVIGLVTVAAEPAQGLTYNVSGLADNAAADGICTLREAMLAANNTPANLDCGAGSTSADEISIAVPGTIVLGAPLPSIAQSLLINGHPDGTTIDGNSEVRPFAIDPSVPATLQSLTITNGLAPSGRSTGGLLPPTTGEHGGAIHNRGSLSLGDVRITHSVAGRGGHGGGGYPGAKGGNGGAIYNAGTLFAFRVTFDGNSSGRGGCSSVCYIYGDGGAIYHESGAMTLLATTFTGNKTSNLVSLFDSGAGAALYSKGQVTIVASTFLGNFTPTRNPAAIVLDGGGAMELAGTIVADGKGCARMSETSLGFFDRGYNLSVPGAGCGFSSGTGSIPDWSEPVLEPELRNNGGAVPTLALLSSSRARDVVPVSFFGCGTFTDARGVERPQGAACDVGAFEIGPNFRRAEYELVITGAGSGSGTVSSNGIDCSIDADFSSGDCAHEYVKGTAVDLAAIAAADSIFAGWGGDPGCADGSIVMDDHKSCTATFDLRALSVHGSVYGVGQAPPPNSRGRARMTFDAEFAFAGAIDLASATLTIRALLSEDEEGGAGELVAGLPLVLHARPGSGATVATFASPPRVMPGITADVNMEDPSVATVAMTVVRATLPRFPQLCSLASLPPTTNLTTTFTLDDGIHPPVTVTSREPWRCRGLIPNPVFPLEPDRLTTR